MGRETSYGAYISATARFLPERVVTNADLEEFVDTSDEWIRERTGIAERRFLAADEPTSKMAIAVGMDDAPRAQLDAGRALQQMELMAWSEGVGMCFVGVREADQQKAIKDLLNIPEGMELITLLPFGYRAEGATGQGTPRKALDEIAHCERFGETAAAV